jgi:hypothetical protein
VEVEMSQGSRRWGTVVAFAVAMAWFEAAAVAYLRVLLDRVQPYQFDPLPAATGLGPTELMREAATLVMLLAVGWLAGRTWRSRVAYAAIAFGVWDLCFYLFLKVITGWPGSLHDWDILFLLPLPWWGPVLAPMEIALLMVIGGTLVSQRDRDMSPFWPSRAAWVASGGGVALALRLFMADALRLLGAGSEAIRRSLPGAFSWPLFSLALGMMAVPVLQLASWAVGRRGACREQRFAADLAQRSGHPRPGAG